MNTKVIGADLQWKRDGKDWLLCLGRRRFGRVVPDAKWLGMFRSVLSGGRLSDMANLTWSKNAVLDAAVRELEWEARQEPATDPQKPQQTRGVFQGRASLMRRTRRPSAGPRRKAGGSQGCCSVRRQACWATGGDAQ
jgi:hypothetical protein